MSNACAPIPLQWKAGPIFALHSVIRSVKLAKIGRGDEASSSVENDLLILDKCAQVLYYFPLWTMAGA